MLNEFRLYRQWKGGKWYYLKAKNTPPMRMFAWWTRQPDLYSDITIIHAEDHGVQKRKIRGERIENKMRELFCDNECNKKLDFIYVNGYDFGDRMMEGVKFKVRVIDGKPECFGLHKDSEPYMTQFNWGHWKKRCEEYCEKADIAQCPHCREDILIEDDETVASRPKPIAIGKAESATDVLKKLKSCILTAFIKGVTISLILTS